MAQEFGVARDVGRMVVAATTNIVGYVLVLIL